MQYLRARAYGDAQSDQVYVTSAGGGAKIVDKFGGPEDKAETTEAMGQRQSAAI